MARAKKVKEFEYEYDPIKEQTGGEKSEAVVWTTKAINKALDGIKRGMPLKVNPFIGKNTNLLRPELVYRKTEEEIEEYIKCMDDPIYFAKFCKLMTPKGLKLVTLRDYQEDYLRHLSKHNFSIFLSCRQSGKSTTTAIFCLWTILFNTDMAALILSKSGPAGIDLLHKIKDMFLHLPYWLKPGIYKWNEHEISFDNNSKIATEAFSPTAGLGQTINFLILDEFAWTPPNETELFYMNVIPTVTTMPNAKVCIMSTQNGFNFFYKLWHKAILHESEYAPFKVDWNQVPDYDVKTDTWIKRTEEWKNKMIGILGSEEYFYYQYGTQFSSSNYCLINREKMASIRNNAYDFTNNWTDSLNIFLQYKENLYFDSKFDLNELYTGNFIILVDLAEGGGGDYTIFNIIQIIGPKKLKQIGYWRSNKINIEHAALEFWLLTIQLFNDGRSIISIEWNTYGELFYKVLLGLNEYEISPEYSFRFNVNHNGENTIDINNIVHYKQKVLETPGVLGKKEKITVPGIKMTKGNKATACTLLKLYIENDTILLSDIVTITELENFEDKHNNGSYEASFGHDDLIMTFVQLPLLMQTMHYKNLMEDVEAKSIEQSIMPISNNDMISGSIYDFGISNSIVVNGISQYYEGIPRFSGINQDTQNILNKLGSNGASTIYDF